MKSGTAKQIIAALFLTVIVGSILVGQAIACTRTLYVGDDGTVITGRNMDWKEDMASNLWIFPAGMQRAGAAGPRSIQWESKYGSVCVSGYEAGTTSTVLRLSSCGERAQRATGRERATRDYYSRPTQYFLHDLADGF
jgi:hypothetical protein